MSIVSCFVHYFVLFPSTGLLRASTKTLFKISCLVHINMCNIIMASIPRYTHSLIINKAKIFAD